jgi:hypothetical protein
MPRQPKYIAGFYANERFCVVIKSNDLYYIQHEADAQNFELRQRLTAIKRGNKRLNKEYKVLRKITNQLQLEV